MNERWLEERRIPERSSRRHARLCRRSSPSFGAGRIGLLPQSPVPRAGPRLAVPHPSQHGDPQDVRRQGRVPRSARGRLDARRRSPPGSSPSCRPDAPPEQQLAFRHRRSQPLAGRGERRRGLHAADGLLERVDRAADGVDVAPARDAARWSAQTRRRSAPAPAGRYREPSPRPVLRYGSRSERARQRRKPRQDRVRPVPPAGQGRERRIDARRQSEALAASRGALVRRTAEVEAVHEPRTAGSSPTRGRWPGFRLLLEGDGLSHRHDAVVGIEALGPRRQRVRRPHNGFGMILFGHNPPFIRRGDRGAARGRAIEIGPQTPLAGDVARHGLRDDGHGARRVLQHRLRSRDSGDPRRTHRVSGRDTIAMFAGAYHGDLRRSARPRDDSGRTGCGPCRSRPASRRAWSRTSSSSSTAAPESLDDPEGARRRSSPPCSSSPCRAAAPNSSPSSSCASSARSPSSRRRRWSSTRSSPDSARTRAAPRRCSAMRADIATYGKVVGGGLPIGVVAGKREVHGCARRRRLALRRRFGPGGRRDVLRRHLRPPSARPRRRARGARSA